MESGENRPWQSRMPGGNGKTPCRLDIKPFIAASDAVCSDRADPCGRQSGRGSHRDLHGESRSLKQKYTYWRSL